MYSPDSPNMAGKLGQEVISVVEAGMIPNFL